MRVIFTSPTNHFESCSTEGYGARKTTAPADASDDEESEPEIEPVESENSSTTNPYRQVFASFEITICSEKKSVFRIMKRKMPKMLILVI